MKSRTKRKKLEKMVSEIRVVNDNDLSPYIETLNISPENITQKPLGTLLGFFEIKDDSKDSAYIVNFLSSVAKKEYFSNPKRTPSDSLEAALHKVNVALSEIAKHNNISWIGKLDVALCSIADSHINFSVTGEAKVLLMRNEIMTEISEGLASKDAQQNPIKTFIDISSGRIKKDDKLIITSDDIFHVLSQKEIEQGAAHFSNKKFARFIKTALVNELSIAGSLIVDVSEKEYAPLVKKEKKKAAPTEKAAQIPNAFSQVAFTKEEEVIVKTKEKEERNEEKNQIQESEYVDKKTGHIYLKDNNEPIVEDTQAEKIKIFLEEKYFDFKCWTRNKFLRKIKRMSFMGIKHNLTQKTKQYKESLSSFKEQLSKKDAPLEDTLHQEQAEVEAQEQEMEFERSVESKNSFDAQKIFSMMLPDFSKMKKLFLKMNQKQKYSLLAILMLIVIAPLVIGNQKDEPQTAPAVIEPEVKGEQQESSEQEQLLSQENLINFIANEQTILSSSTLDLKKVTSIKLIENELFLIMENKVVVCENNEVKKEFLFLEGFSKPRLVTYMDSLNMFFILTDKNQLLSFNSKSKQFQHNTIDIPEDSQIAAMGTYMTYMYLMDQKNNQIFRYPRAEGGFGERTSWLQENVKIENISDVVVDGKIILLFKDKRPIAFFRNNVEEFSFESTAVPMSFDQIRATDELKEMYILDTKNSRIVKFNDQGKIQVQFHNKNIKDAKDFTIDENGNFFILTSEKLFKIQTYTKSN